MQGLSLWQRGVFASVAAFRTLRGSPGRASLWAFPLCSALLACGSISDDHPPPAPVVASNGGGSSVGGTGADTNCEGPPKPDASGLCGNQVVPVLQEKPNLYFVLDSSGSMQGPMDDGGNRLGAAKTAITNVLHDLGHRIRYGLAVYPGYGVDACATGGEIFETREGDPIQCVNKRVAGPVLTAFAKKLSTVAAVGGTPIAATLEAIQPTVTGLHGQTFVVLLTDGAPNCSLEANCGIADCTLNLESRTLITGQVCDDTFNCCDPIATNDATANTQCVDRDGTIRAVTELADAGVKTFVVGVPGSEYYSDLLNQLAVAGGTARQGEDQAYYPVNDSRALSSALKSIGTSVATTCEITLQEGSKIDPSTINVYFDATLLPSDTVDGWTYLAPTITLHGKACDQLLAGDVVQVQVVAGCPTIIR